jgi:hypothetical protein
MTAPAIEIHESVREPALTKQAIACLEANCIEPKFLYVTPRQAALWREVFLRYSPIHGNPEFWRIYREAFDAIAKSVPLGPIELVGLGCGTGVKEGELFKALRAAGNEVHFAALDTSDVLVAESMQTLAEGGALSVRGLACDLDEADSVAQWLGRVSPGRPRVLTLFGLTPNLLPSSVARLAQAVVRPGDVLLINAHLAPVSDGVDIEAAMRRVLPQYDQLETSTWLAAGLENWGIDKLAEPPRMTIGEVEGVPAFVATARWKPGAPFEKWGHRFTPDPGQPLRVFRSLRYTPSLFESIMSGHGLKLEMLAITACREEAIWAIRAA